MTRILFPQELIGEIFSHLRPSTDLISAHDPLCSSTLAACSVVSKSFLYEARPILYSRIEMVTWADEQHGAVPHPASQLEATLRSNPYLAKLLGTFTWTIIAPVYVAGDTGHPRYDSPIMSSLLPKLVGVKQLKFQVERKEIRSHAILWSCLSTDLRASIAQVLTQNKQHITALRFHRFTVPPSLYIQIPKLTTLSFFGNPAAHERPGEQIPFSGTSTVANIRCINTSNIIPSILRENPQALEATTSVTMCLDHNKLRSRHLGLEELLVGTQKSLSSLKLYLSYGGEVLLNFRVPHMKQLTDLEIHWELDDIFPGYDQPAALSGFFTLVLPLLNVLLKSDTLVNISTYANRRCEDKSQANNFGEKFALASIFDDVFRTNCETLTKLRNVSLTLTYICPRGQCDQCADFVIPPSNLTFLPSQKQLDFCCKTVRRSAQRRFSEFQW